ncbi:hypothetical protein MKK50_15320 [Methylobacterium sp. J-043]|nr:hypothetical protein [Methylobacterium sp. J-043]
MIAAEPNRSSRAGPLRQAFRWHVSAAKHEVLMPLPEGSTVVTISHLLAEKDEYVRKALNNFRPEYKKNPNATLTIGLMGDGKYPNYRIDQPLNGTDVNDGLDVSIDWPELVFRGRSHDKLVDPSKVKFDNWSRSSVKYLELETLLGEMRRLKKLKV